MTAATVPLRGLAAREPVSLDELNRTAALLTRVDRKYVLTAAEADAFILGLPREARVLDIDGSRRFGYHSTYFDTAELTCFLGTAHRRRRRYKVRTRRYLDSGDQFLEVKTRRGGCTVKHRVAWGQPIRHLDGGAREFVAEALGEEHLRLDHELGPVLDVTYTRSTFLMPDGAARATVDTHLTWLDRQTGCERTADGLVIVETKSSSSPSVADRTLWGRGHRPVSMSKYATGLATLRPELPHNRWHRLLARTELTAA